MTEQVHSVLFVCMGNICRSPSAEGVMRKLIAERYPGIAIHIDSAGTHAYHVGEPPDERAVAAALARGIDIAEQRARQVTAEDFDRFDHILAMDSDNLARLRDLQPAGSRARVSLLLEYSALEPGGDIPDPYYGGEAGFERVLDLLQEASERFLEGLLTR